MAKPRASIGSHRNPESHAAILDAAAALLAEHGYAGVTFEAVARRAGAGKPTLYRWWPNKAALLIEVYDREKVAMEAARPTLPDPQEDFADLVRASALSPAMLWYLDGRENRKGCPEDRPNENYARELLELHTLGVHGGYTQQDVMEVARCLTGWTVRGLRRDVAGGRRRAVGRIAAALVEPLVGAAGG